MKHNVMSIGNSTQLSQYNVIFTSLICIIFYITLPFKHVILHD
jgi:hypothetical protein